MRETVPGRSCTPNPGKVLQEWLTLKKQASMHQTISIGGIAALKNFDAYPAYSRYHLTIASS